ncbi:MAG: hypothetical protein WD250_06235 [Egibacteraceae bacterium]
MALWWLGNLIFVAVVIPVVVTLLNNLMEPIVEIRRYGDDVLEHGVLLIAALDAVDELENTRDLLAEVSSGVKSYGAALKQL